MPDIVRLKITLDEVHPCVVRRIEVPLDLRLDDLHLVIQAVMRHTVKLESVAEAEPDVHYPRLLAAQGRCPPEDVGGTEGYDEFLEAIGQPGHPEHRRMLEWYGGPYDPDDLDLPLIRRRVGLLANRRAAGQAAYARSRRKG